MVRALTLVMLLASTSLHALDEPDRTDITFYRGQFTRSNLGNIALKADTDFKPSYIFTGAVSQPAPMAFFWPAHGMGGPGGASFRFAKAS